MGGAQYAASAAQHSMSPMSPVAASTTSSTGGHAPRPASSTTGPDPTSTPTAGAGNQQSQHKRVYQACIPCRRRKVRCDLGSVDDPHDPPCVRCRRECKECYFSATRRKRKNEDDPAEELDERDADDYILRNGRKQARTEGPLPSIDRRLFSDVPLTPAGGPTRSHPLRRPGDPKGSIDTRSSTTGEFGAGEPNTPLENFEARSVMRREVYGPHDALDLLYKAATDNSPHKHDDHTAASGSTSQSNAQRARPDAASRHPSSQNRDRDGYLPRQASRREGTMDPAIDPELIKRDTSADPGYGEALKAWARFRFVRAGWFTAQEAIDYIEYYYDYLSPLTPISPPTFRSPASHLTLLTEEPILAVTLLTISSRYRKLPGTGAKCRAHAIHEQLWTYLRGMIERVVWGQEAFGGGFCGSGADEAQSSSTAPWRGLRRGSLRTFGTIESLMILTEWHPRALHFPPSEAIDELLLPSYDQSPMDDELNQRTTAGVGGRRIDSWLEPAWRSDRMCWMLLSTAMGLAYELGVFDDIDELLATGAITRPEYEEESYRLRAYRIKRLLLIYLSQLAGRLGWTNMVPENLRKSDPVVSRRRPHSVEGTTPATNPSSLSNGFNYIPDLELDDQIIHCWAGISNAMHIGNERLFRSRKHTTDIIQSGRYITLLKDFQPMLRDWWKEFERFRMPQYIRHILTIEYEYVRIYVNSLSLQAVVERCTNNAGGGSAAGGSVSGHSAPQLSPQTQNYYGKLPLGQLGGFGVEDQEYVREVVSGSRNLLRTVVEGLLPGDFLKHAPVRTYFRIISGAMFLLKTFALGAPKADVEMSIGLMDRTVDALRNCVVDDVHLGIRFADMLETLTSRLRNRFIHAPANAISTTDGRSPAQNHTTEMNGRAANGHGQQPTGMDVWMKLKESGEGPERSGTPANISATPWDLTTGTFPYPSGSASMFGPSTPAATTGVDTSNNNANGLADGIFDHSDWTAPGNEMWYLPTGPAFFSNVADASVSMTAEGVNVGGMDLLDFMTMDDQGYAVMDGNGF
ncbi:hypothetical protein B0T16DRAFT_414070 [Cercophora newfieldiana]|uniref:Zn(2)-C6 fungal-type domain-containing protein n=1 Tax=Cercophora newfieldiana TaxID=92897 RepID=A0AA39Y793_9PEZI|nr:hypothetical protein B0T16DRAFT_414070 [Cercophora newfieldiana]